MDYGLPQSIRTGRVGSLPKASALIAGVYSSQMPLISENIPLNFIFAHQLEKDKVVYDGLVQPISPYPPLGYHR